jgi:hypothetical protein
MKEFKFTNFGTEERGTLLLARYHDNDNLAVQLLFWDNEVGGWQSYARLSTNLGKKLEHPLFAGKIWNENTGLCEQMVELGLFEDTGERVNSGHVSAPIYKLTELAKQFTQEN